MGQQCDGGIFSHLMIFRSDFFKEFFHQGDQERARGLPVSPFMDRNTANMPKSQATFIKFVVSPLLQSFEHVLKPELMTELTNNLQSNEKRWIDKGAAPSP